VFKEFKPMASPTFCKPAALDYFRRQLPIIDTDTGLIRAAVAVSMHELDVPDASVVEAYFDNIAQQVRSRVHGRQPQALVAHLHDVLFDELNYVGNSSDYYNPFNCYLPKVIETRTGLPLSMSLVYTGIARRLGLHVFGINAPVHFLAGIQEEGRVMIVDPYYSGHELSREEVVRRVAQVTARPQPGIDEILRPASHSQWIGRLIQNLYVVFGQQGRQRDAAAMVELHKLLQTG
jgi:regulator of sirC expression with transglutaminase-like and TPR domain